MELIVNNKKINAPIYEILVQVKSELRNGKLRSISPQKDDDVAITCPVHKGGMEKHPSCNVYCRKDNPNIEYGKCHCFTCGFTSSLGKLISVCFDEFDDSFGDEWLAERFGEDIDNSTVELPEIVLNTNKKSQKKYLSEDILKDFDYYHDYMWKRNLSKEVVDRFRVGFNPKNNSITFPTWDVNGNLVMVPTRSVTSKRFYIDADADKPVYLLNHIVKNNISSIYVTEGPLDALRGWSLGLPTVAMFGTGSYAQYKILNSCGVRVFNLLFDGDEAGRKGAKRFMKNVRKDVIVNEFRLPEGEDLNHIDKNILFNILNNS